MGVTGLLVALKSIQQPTTLEKYRGKTLAIDTYAWLHKAVFSCAEEIVLEKPTKAYIKYFEKKLSMLQHFGITPYFVFDGDYLPSKGSTENSRSERRKEYKRLAVEAKNNGNLKLAFKYFQQACDISPELAKSVINLLKLKSIQYVVAPYEADSQMVFLEKIGCVDGIISEDSDLLIFGCKTLITKLNDRGECIEVNRSNFKNCTNSHIKFFDDDQLLLMATISGCDYTKGIPGFGIQKAIASVQNYKTYERVILSLKVENKVIPPTFESEYQRAKIAFRHQIVFNPIEKIVQHLNPLTEEILSKYSKEYILSCTGNVLEDLEIHRQLSKGLLHPFSKTPLMSYEMLVSPHMKRSNTMPIQHTESPCKPSDYSALKRSNTIALNLKSRMDEPVVKRNSASKINQFASLIRTRQNKRTSDPSEITATEENKSACQNQRQYQYQTQKDNGKVKVSPLAKRQKLLNKNESSQSTISHFFSTKKRTERPTSKDGEVNDKTSDRLLDTSILSNSTMNNECDINVEDFYATSSDIEDITEDNIKDLNMKLSEAGKTSENESSVIDSSNIHITDSEQESEYGKYTGIVTKDFNSSIEISDQEDIINSSDISQSTVNIDKTFTRNTPTTISIDGNSSSSLLSMDPGEINTECFINEDEFVGNSSRNYGDVKNEHNKSSGDDDRPVIDKSNILAGLYSFSTANVSSPATLSTKSNTAINVCARTSTPLGVSTNRQNEPFNSSVFASNQSVNGIVASTDTFQENTTLRSKSRVHKPSPLNNRIPLQDVTARVNVRETFNGKGKNSGIGGSRSNNAIGERNARTRLDLSRFKFTDK